jgi:hypothetical protein
MFYDSSFQILHYISSFFLCLFFSVSYTLPVFSRFALSCSTISVTATTPVGDTTVGVSITGGSNLCQQSWTNTIGSYGAVPNNGQFEISGTTLQLKSSIRSANPPGLNFEDCRPPDGYSVQVRATKDSYSENCQVLLKVGDVNESPKITLDQTFTIAENSDATQTCTGGPVVATDSEVDNGIQAITWTVDSGCTTPGNVDLGSNCPFVIGVCDGQLRVATSQYLDAAALNFESTTWRTVYSLQIKANDDGPGGGKYDTKAITLTITDVNEPPIISGTANGGSAFTVPEFATHGTVVTGNSGVIAASDVDTLGGHDTQLTFTQHNAGNVPFAVSSIGVVTVDLSEVTTTGPIDFEAAQKVHDLIVSVADTGWGTNPVRPLTTSTVVITVSVTDENDDPVIDTSWKWTGNTATDTVLVFAEDCNGASTSAAGSSLPTCTKQLLQTDPDDDNTGSDDTAQFNSNSNGWTLTDNCGGNFVISASGILSTANSRDYETAVAMTAGNDPYYCTVTAKVVDGSNAADTMVIAVKIADVNEAPSSVDKVAACWTYENAAVNTVA